jgi:hypothetical protein
MKNRIVFLLATISFLTIFPQIADCQYTKIENNYTFGTNITNPIVVEVEKSEDKVAFYAMNKSLLPYNLTVTFTNIQNLFPMITSRDFVVQPGKNTVLTLSIVNKTQSIQYQYKYTYSINLTEKPDLSFPYLIPIGKGKIAELIPFKGVGNVIYEVTAFKLLPGDTVYAIRKGVITALPDDNQGIQRVFSTLSLEVLQGDGTLAIYRGLDPSHSILNLRQTVYPGQPIGIIGESGILTLNIYAKKEGVTLKTVEIFFSDQDGGISSCSKINGTKVSYPLDVIKKEMTKGEIRKFEKGNLF